VHNSTWTWFGRFFGLSLVLSVLGIQAGCESIIGLEERKLVSDGGTEPTATVSRLCMSYCDDVNKSCKPPKLDAYKSTDDCQAMCRFLPEGKSSDSETKGNTVKCRAHYAQEAASVERDVMFCPAAAPGGGSPGIENGCGEHCEAYCGLYSQICPEKPQKDCLNKCRALPDPGGYSAANDYLGGDTIQCRIAHLNAAAVAKVSDTDGDRIEHCGHALLRASLGDRPFCDLPPQTEPNCKDYCKIVMQSCKAQPVYESQAQCEKFCGVGFVKGKNTDAMNVQDINQDTLACRRWHAYFAFDDQGAVHCPHTGPSGDGHCGKICPAYCAELKNGCPTQFSAQYPGADGATKCEADCKNVRGFKEIDMGYDVTSEEYRTDTLQCRFGMLVDAANGKDTCAKAMPQGSCSR
jgi:hypothetical protein